MKRPGIISAVSSGITILVVAAGAVVGWRFIRADMAAKVYQQRLAELADDYETLRTDYNALVRKTAVTELVVRGRHLSVRMRSPAGVIRELSTPYDPAGEIYVDYVVIDGRIWIRRLFDAFTAPGMGLVIDPELAEIDWDDPSAAYGKAVYRRLSEGRWVVTVTGGGALGLVRSDDSGATQLFEPPRAADLAEIHIDAKDAAGDVTAGEAIRRLVLGE